VIETLLSYLFILKRNWAHFIHLNNFEYENVCVARSPPNYQIGLKYNFTDSNQDKIYRCISAITWWDIYFICFQL